MNSLSVDDTLRELSNDEMALAVHAHYTDNGADLAEADIIIVAVPTPVDDAHIPDFRPLIGASTSAGRNLKRGAVVVSGGITYEGRRVVPDVSEDVGEVASWITPRLGGVGPTTVAMLLRNTVTACSAQSHRV